MKKIYFFTDIDKLKIQAGADRYGEQSVEDGMDCFRITSSHQCDVGDKENTAYCICDGEVVIVEVSDTDDYLTIVLKPTDHSYTECGLPKVKYFVYRGVRKDSLVDSSGNILESGSDLSARITQGLTSSVSASTVFKKVITDGTTVTDPRGYEMFDSEYSYVMKGGDSLGKFVNSDMPTLKYFGLDVVLDVSGEDEPCSFFASKEQFVKVHSLTSPFTEMDYFVHRRRKEDVLRYFDICAFYGSLFNYSIWGKKGGKIMEFKGSGIYENIISFFANHKSVYLDLRNELNQSLNHMGNYSDSPVFQFKVKLEYKKGHVVEKDYYTSYWPVFSFNVENVQANYSAIEKGYGKQHVVITLPNSIKYTQDDLELTDNLDPIVFISQGLTIGKNKKEEASKKFVKNSGAEFLGKVDVVLPVYENEGIALVWCSMLKIKCLKMYSSGELGLKSKNMVIRPLEYLDNVFRPLDYIRPKTETRPGGNVRNNYRKLNTDDQWQVQVYEEELFTDTLRYNESMCVSNVGVCFNEKQDEVLLFLDPTHTYIDSRERIKEVHNHLCTQIINKANDEYTAITAMAECKKQSLLYGINEKNFKTIDDRVGTIIEFSGIEVYPIVLDIKDFESKFYSPFTIESGSFSFVSELGCSVGFRMINGGTARDIDTNNELFNYECYELVLRGYYVNGADRIDVHEVPLLTRIYLKSSIDKIDRMANKSIKRGLGFELKKPINSSENYNYTELNGTSMDIPGDNVFVIKSTIYLLRGWGISQSDFILFKNELEYNIKKGYSSGINVGISSKYIPSDIDPEDVSSGTFTRKYYFKTAEINVDIAKSDQYKYLKPGECLFVLESNNKRDYVIDQKKRKLGSFSLPPNPSTLTDEDKFNTYAKLLRLHPYYSCVSSHEFCHILGLSDRYSYLAFVENVLAMQRYTDSISSKRVLYKKIVKGFTVPLYNSKWDEGSKKWKVFDVDYGASYNWFHNIASDVGWVGELPTEAASNYYNDTRTYRAFMAPYRPTIGSVEGVEKMTKIAFFITDYQVERILNYYNSHIPEEDYNRGYISFVDKSADSFVKPEKDNADFVERYTAKSVNESHLVTFAGPDEKYGMSQLFASDYGYTFYTSIQQKNARLDYNKNEASMAFRKRKSGGDGSLNCLYGYLNIGKDCKYPDDLTEHGDKIEYSRVVKESLYRTGWSDTNMFSTDQLTTGGSAYSRSAYNVPMRLNYFVAGEKDSPMDISKWEDYFALPGFDFGAGSYEPNFNKDENGRLYNTMVFGSSSWKSMDDKKIRKFFKKLMSGYTPEHLKAQGVNFNKILMSQYFYMAFHYWPLQDLEFSIKFSIYEREFDSSFGTNTKSIRTDFSSDKDRYNSPGDSDIDGNGYKIWNAKIVPYIDYDNSVIGDLAVDYNFRKKNRGLSPSEKNFGTLWPDGNSLNSYKGDSGWKFNKNPEVGAGITRMFDLRYNVYPNREPLVELNRVGLVDPK